VVAGTETVTRFSAEGQLDTSFGNDGVAFIPDSLVEGGVTEFGFLAGDVAIDDQGRILLVANSGVLALNSDGNLDLSLDSNGFQDIDFDIISTLEFDESGRLVVTGTRSDVFGSDFQAAVVNRFELA